MTKEAKQLINEIDRILHNFDLISDKIKWVQIKKEDILQLALQSEIAELKFYKLTSLLSSQSRSHLWEKYFKEKNKYKSVSKSENKGDLKKDNRYYEYKVSLNDQINFRLIQIRVWQECDYIFQFITFEKIYTFQLSKKEMLKEMELCGANFAHGTKEANENNKNVEYTMTIRKESDHWNRWMQKYLQK